MTVDLTKLIFLSSLNYLKRSNFFNNDTVTLGGANTQVVKNVDHNLGYIPFIHVAADLQDNGVLWANDIVDKYTETSLSSFSNDYPTLEYWTTNNILTISIYNHTSPAATGTRRVYWGVYLDYGD